MAMSEQPQPVAGAAASTTKARTSFGILGAISLSHLLNDMIQSLILAIYPLLQSEFSLTFMQIGMITLTFQLASSLLQPVVGYWTDKYPMPWSLPIGMCFTLSGLVLLALAGSFGAVLLAAALVGTGSSVFHPESSRVARMASGGRHGLAQSIFQVGGNFGSSLGPVLAAVIIAPYGKGNVAWFVLAALLAIVVLAQISRWYSAQHRMNKGKPKATIINPLPRNKVVLAVSILLILIFSKYFYMSSISSYYTLYLMQKFGLSIQNAQLHLFAFLFAVAAGTVIGGPVGDKIGRKYVIWGSILGVAPFTLILPYASLHWTGGLTVIIGFILASAFSAILVYAQELLPGRIGMVSGLFFGFAFGMGGLGAAVLGLIADHTSIELVYKICAFLPLLGVLKDSRNSLIDARCLRTTRNHINVLIFGFNNIVSCPSVSKSVKHIKERFAIINSACNAISAAQRTCKISLWICIYAENLFALITHQIGEVRSCDCFARPTFFDGDRNNLCRHYYFLISSVVYWKDSRTCC